MVPSNHAYLNSNNKRFIKGQKFNLLSFIFTFDFIRANSSEITNILNYWFLDIIVYLEFCDLKVYTKNLGT